MPQMFPMFMVPIMMCTMTVCFICLTRVFWRLLSVPVMNNQSVVIDSEQITFKQTW